MTIDELRTRIIMRAITEELRKPVGGVDEITAAKRWDRFVEDVENDATIHPVFTVKVHPDYINLVAHDTFDTLFGGTNDIIY